MKKQIFAFVILFMLTLGACSNQSMPFDSAQLQNITMLDAGVWPANAYTEGIPVPPGTVAWAMLDAEHKSCSVSITNISESDFAGYMEILEQEGFFVIENTSEEIEGENYISIGTLLSDDTKFLSISYIPNSLTIYIS